MPMETKWRRVGAGAMTLLAAALLIQACGDDPTSPAANTLTVEVTGDGAGAVTSQPAGIDCTTGGGECSAEFESGTSVTLTATPAGGSNFSGWSQACTGTAGCTVEVTAATTVGASFDDPATGGAVIGPDGGSVSSADGAVTLDIPAGALGDEQEITIARSDTSALGAEWDEYKAAIGGSAVYDLGPDGLTFQQPVTVSLKSEKPLVEAGDTLSIAAESLLTASDGVIEPLGDVTTTVDADSGTVLVSGELSHFSPLMLLQTAVIVNLVGVPEQLPVGAEVELVAGMRPFPQLVELVAWYGPFAPATYEDRSNGPFQPAFSPTTVDMSPAVDAFFAILPYTCTEAGPSLYISQLQAGVRSSAGEEERSVVANFRKTVDCIGTAHTLTVTKSGTGSGQVHTVDPDSGIDCGDDCDESYAEGTAVQLAAVADAGSVFAGWEGDGTDVEGDAGTLRAFTMDEDRTVDAVFNKIPDEDLDEMTVSLAGNADGSVTSDPAGIDCTKTGDSVTGTCAAPFEHGTTVTLTADPADGAVVGSWTGATGSGNTATVMMNDDLDVMTTFEVQALSNFITLEAYLSNVESIRFVWGDFSLPGGASGGASAPAGIAGFAAAAATVCPPVIVAGHGGAVALDPCTGTTLQTYPVSEDADYYDAFTLPVPEGESGLHSVLVTGESYTQFFVDDAGDVVAHATSLSHGTYFDGSYIGNDPALGAAVARVNGDLSFMQWSESSNEYAFLSGASGDYLAPAMQSAAVDATAKRFLTVGNEGDNGVLYFSDFNTFPLHVEKIADLAGDNPRRIRCDYTSGVCAISDFANSLITIVAWDGETAPTITDVTETGSIAGGPVGIDVYGRTIVAAGFNDDQYTIIQLNMDGTIASVGVNPLPAECTQPGHAFFLRDAVNTILASCYGSTGIARVPNAF